jgi:GNAT superfamily N-acetyltransferase
MTVTIRRATRADVRRIVEIVAEDAAHAEADLAGALPEAYLAAFDEIDGDPRNGVYVAEDVGLVVGTFQLTFVRHLMRRGCLVAQIETVHVTAARRSQGVGEAMIRWAVGEARRRGALRVQLTSNKNRPRAHAFYERLGFERSHEGFKLYL